MAPRISKEDADWRAEDDARTLAQAEAIKADKKRMSAAAKKARAIAKERAQEAAAMKKIAAKSKARKKAPAKRGKK